MALAAGSCLDRYEVLSLLGAGGMGEVYLARDTRLNRKVALKLLPARFTKDPERVRRFEQEARAASALNHPNIITIYEVGEVSETHFIAAEFVEGRTLRWQIKQSGMELHETLEVMIQVAAALAAAHEAKIVHRDIKPDNIMVRPDGLVKVLDFGLAKLTERDGDAFGRPPGEVDTNAPTHEPRLTESGTVMGTATYMSPEQTRGQEVDARTDIFSLGVVLYEMITGRTPFTGATNSDISAAILMIEAAPLSQRAPGAPAELERIVSKALRKDRLERYQTSKDLLVDLKNLKQDLEFEAKQGRTSGVTTPAQTGEAQAQPTTGVIVWKPSPRLAIIALLAMTIVGVLGWWLAKRLYPSDAEVVASLRRGDLYSWKSEPSEGDGDAVISPDGKMIAFTSSQNGGAQIWLKLVSAGEPRQISEEGKYNRNPIWSPDGQQITYLSQQGNQTGIWRIPAIGGAPTLLGVLPNKSLRLRSWSKDQATIYYESQSNLFAFNVSSGQVTQVTRFDPATSVIHSFSLSPGEDRVAYVERKDGRSGISVMPIGGGRPVQVTNDPASMRNLVWHPDGKRIIYSSYRDGTYQIFVAYLDGRAPLQLTTDESDSLVTGVSADGTKILYCTLKEESNLWGVSTSTGDEFEVTSDLGLEFWPDVSPDNKRIVFQAVRGMNQGGQLANCSILTKPIEIRSQQMKLAANGFSPSWSPDGSRIAFLRSPNNLGIIWTVRATGGDEKQLTVHGIKLFGYSTLPYNRNISKFYAWSPDSKRIIYVSKEPHEESVWIVSADGAETSQIASHPGSNISLHCPLWSPDGERLAYISEMKAKAADGSTQTTWQVWLTEMGTKKPEAIFQTGNYLRLIGWSPSGKEVIVAMAEGNKGATFQTSPEISLIQVATGGDRQQMARLKSAYFYDLNIQLSPDRRTIAFASRQDGKDNIWVVPISGSEARKITINNETRTYFSSLAWAPDGKAIYYGKQVRWGRIAILEHFK